MTKRKTTTTTPAAPDRLVPRQKALPTLGCSDVTDYRRRKSNPLWPKPVVVGSRRLYYRQSDLDAYLASLAHAG